MTKTPAIQKDIIAHLRAAGRAETSRSLASRFLRIEHGDEETCRRLLAPFLATVPGIVHRPEEGWSLAKNAPRATGTPIAIGTGTDAGDPLPVPETGAPPRQASSGARPDGTAETGLDDFVALASEGAGPGGSGAVRVVSLLPVIAGEECQEEHFPAWALDEDARQADEPAGAGLAPEVLEDLLQTIGDLPVVCHRVAREVEPLRRLCAGAGLAFQAPVVSAAKLGHLLLGLKSSHAAGDLAAALGQEARGPDDCRGRVRLVAASFLRLVPLLQERGIDSIEALIEYQDMPAAPLDLSGCAFSAEDLRALPASPGVYRFLDIQGRVFYVGKAKNLRVRLGSYFTPSARGTAKGRAVLEQIHSFQFDTVASEMEAALVEAALIAEHRPRLNRQFDVHE
ncbi:MAG: nucleotide excision repair endonuclease, partial [Acidobacteria bacterium]|nr:nucleotide excision repair endonuclease [Acidobacteriota bacterium]